MEDKRKRLSLWNFVDNLEGDKVVWMIAILLVLFSILAIFSSTSQLALTQDISRMDILMDQLKISALGLGVMVVCCLINKIGLFRMFSQLGFGASMFLLLILVFEKKVGPFEPVMINHAWRVLKVGGVQVHVFEFVKVAMVMYLSWAVNAFLNDSFSIAKALGRKYEVFNKAWMKQVLYIYFPMFAVCLGIMKGSLSSTLFIGAVMFFTILIGGISMRKLLLPIGAAVLVLIGCFVINSASDKPDEEKPFPHLQSAVNRVTSEKDEFYLEKIKSLPSGDPGFRKAMDKIKQPYSAKIAIHEGGLIGKGPGRSSQRYVVPIMFEDYMFSFIIEEYGLLGGIFVIILYISLLARGSIIVRNCENSFAKTAVAGLVVLISGQAMMHMVICCDVGILTGQTLPMISHGSSSFLMFSLAFGIILSISKMAKRKIEREETQAAPFVDRSGEDEIRGGLDDLDWMEGGDPAFAEEGLESDNENY